MPETAKHVVLARERQQRDLGRQRTANFPYWYDEEAAALACEFFPRFCKHWKGPMAGKPFELSSWQAEDIVGPLFGWKRMDGSRRFRVCWVEIPRKNGKSTLAAGMSFLFSREEEGGEVYSIATKKDQARIIFDSAKMMLKSSEGLQKVFTAWAHSITVPHKNSTFKALGADHDTMDGLNPSTVLADEIHKWPNRHLWDVMETGMIGRWQALMAAFTTAGECKPNAIGWELHNKAVSVLEGATEDEEMFAFVSAADKDDDFEDPAVWWKVNPNMGISIFEDRVAKALEKAKQSPAFLRTFLNYHLNLWKDEADKALTLEAWDACKVEMPDLTGRPCFAGLDLSAKIDLTALVLVFPPVPGDDRFYQLPFFWLPEETIPERSKSVPYDLWVKQLHIEVTPGAIVDYQFVQKRVSELAKKYVIREIAFDPWGGWETASRLQDAGFRMVECRQGYKTLSEPTKQMIGLVKGKKLAHDGNPVLRWAAHNLVLNEDSAGNVKPDKKKSPEKIDPAVASIMGLSRALYSVEKPSVYRNRGLRTLG